MITRVAALLITGGLLAGCSEMGGPFARDDQPSTRGDRAQLAAFAANSEYPEEEASDDLRMTAMVDTRNNTLTVINPSDRNITNARVWINGQFVGRLDAIPANGSARMNFGQFYDRTGRNLADTQAHAQRIELQTDDNFYRLLGPVFETR